LKAAEGGASARGDSVGNETVPVRVGSSLLKAGIDVVSAMPASGIGPETALDLAHTAHDALAVNPSDRQAVENRVSRCISGLDEYRSALPVDAVTEMSEAATRVLIARRFFNNAVRDTRTLRSARMPRLLHLAGRRELPQFFDIDDTSLLVETPPTGETRSAG